MPIGAEAVVAVAGAELPKRSVPGRRIRRFRVGACRYQPTPDDFPDEAVLKQALAIDAAKAVRPEDAPSVLLQVLELAERGGKFFVWCRHSLCPFCCNTSF